MEIILLFIVLYMLPAIVASCRGHHQTLAITVLNIFAGWTALGWLVALVWACMYIPPSAREYEVSIYDKLTGPSRWEQRGPRQIITPPPLPSPLNRDE
jgi:hypothetical protein